MSIHAGRGERKSYVMEGGGSGEQQAGCCESACNHGSQGMRLFNSFIKRLCALPFALVLHNRFASECWIVMLRVSGVQTCETTKHSAVKEPPHARGRPQTEREFDRDQHELRAARACRAAASVSIDRVRGDHCTGFNNRHLVMKYVLYLAVTTAWGTS